MLEEEEEEDTRNVGNTGDKAGAGYMYSADWCRDTSPIELPMSLLFSCSAASRIQAFSSFSSPQMQCKSLEIR